MKFLLVLLLLGLGSGISQTVTAQDVLRASGGTNISVDNFFSGQYTTISGPTIRETAVGQLQPGNTIVLTLPSGFEWNTALTAENITITISPVGAQNTKLEVAFGSINATQATFNVIAQSTSGGAGQGPGRVTIDGLQLRPATSAVPASGIITNTGTTGPGGSTNYGNLSTAAGTLSSVQVEDSPDGSGSVVTARSILAGNTLTVYSIARDQAGNFRDNIALNDQADWSLINTTGGVTQAALTPATDRRSAVFSSQSTGSAQINASFSGLSSVPTDVITVSPRQPNALAIGQQPSSTAVAGEPFGTQPAVQLLDQFGNIVTTDSATEITAGIAAGGGTLSGTTVVTATNGIATFSDLSADIANSITLRFSTPGLNDVESTPVEVEPADPATLIFLQQPTNTARNATISPAVTVQLQDSFGNLVPESGVIVNISGEPFFANNATLTATTDNDGIALFDDLRIRNNATEGPSTFSASFSGIQAPVSSNAFEILSTGAFASFSITAVDGSPVPTQQTGEPFTVRITARTGGGDLFADFNDTVLLESNSDFLANGTVVQDVTTDNFVNGVLDVTITLVTSGSTEIFATSSDPERTGQSNAFTVEPGDVDFNTTTITAAPQQVPADGASTSTITVQLNDEYGNNLTTGGETITLTTDAGTLSNGSLSGETSLTAMDQGDGRYTAILTASTTVETATVEALESASPIANTTVDFIPGELSEFLISLPETEGVVDDQTAGESFVVTVEAVDANGNRVDSYSGNLEFSTNSVISNGSAAAITNGILENHAITLTQSGTDISISVEDPAVFGVSGNSLPFAVLAAAPDAAASTVVANPPVLLNDGVSESVILITLRDVFNNRVRTDFTSDLTLSTEQIAQDGNPSSGAPDASLSAVSFDASAANYTALLTASTTVEDVEITATINEVEILSKPIVEIVIPNTWTPSGAPQQQTDWERAENWSLGTVPGVNDFVIIPGNAGTFPDLDLNISIGSLDILDGAELVLFGGNSITVAGRVSVDGTLDIEDNTSLFVGGNLTGNGTFTAGIGAEIELSENVSISNFLARTQGTNVTFNGTSQQILTSTNFLAQIINVMNDVLVTSGDLLDTAELFIEQGNTLELATGAGIILDISENITGNGNLILNDNTLVVRGNLSDVTLDTSEGTVIFGVRLDQDPNEFNLSEQQITNLSSIKSAIINNPEGVRTFDDIVIENDGSIILESGELIIGSERSFIAENVIFNGGSLRFLRTISQNGWRMMSSPVDSDFTNYFNGLTLQGISNASFIDRQPNLLYYDETQPGTDNQRWRAPNSADDSFETGRGYFFFVFGNVPNDNDYNDTLPRTLSATGEENRPPGGNFIFPVTYTAEADTGWNLMGNPFGSAIDWDDPGWVKTNMDNVIYIWDEAANQYRYWNGMAGSHGSGKIAHFQGFWVKANDEDPILEVPFSSKTTDGIFRLRHGSEPIVPVIGLQLESDFHTAQTHITFSREGRFTKDDFDAFRLLPFETSSFVDIFSSLSDGTQFAINNLPREFGKPIEIPIHVEAVQDGQFHNGLLTLTWPELENIPTGWTLELVDTETNSRVDLLTDTFYDFNVQANSNLMPQKNTIQNFTLVQKSTAASQSARFKLIIEPGEDGDLLPKEVTLNQNFPNPFNPSTVIEFALPVEDRVRIDVFDVLGRHVQSLANDRFQAGLHDVRFDGARLASGVYFYRLVTSDRVITKKMTLIK
ncbi:MAG: invasin domain 3-containing protein [Balneolaceae bacterium]